MIVLWGSSVCVGVHVCVPSAFLTHPHISHQAAVEVFGLVQELLPAVSALNQKYAPPTFNPNQSTDSTTGNQPEQGLSACTTSSHYAVVESDHPYKPASVTQYKVGTGAPSGPTSTTALPVHRVKLHSGWN